MYNSNIRARSRYHCCSGKAVNITYSECVFVALLSSVQCACVVLSCHLLSASLDYISTWF